MTRRSYLKKLAIIGIAGSAYSSYKWYLVNKSINPQNLYEKEALIAEIAEVIIPQTDSPGARLANVHKYILDVIINCTDVKVQNHFIWGLEDLEKYTVSIYMKQFLECSAEEKNDVVQYFSNNSQYNYPIINKINNKLLGEGFFSKFKSLTVEGYCRSKLGASEGLTYDYLPGYYHACIPMKINQKSWATK